MGARTVKFGLTLPQFGASWSEVKEIASLADEVGWDSVWVADHFLGVGSDDPLEAWTEMSAVAAITRRVELGFLVLCNSYRPPALLAKMAATLDAVSHGRLILGYGAGWFAQEYEAYGYDFPPIGTRLRQLEEGLQILKRMWTEEQATFHGAHYHVENARCLPRPTRKPHPPILIGGAGEKVLLKLVARYADLWNNLGPVLRSHVAKRTCEGRLFGSEEGFEGGSFRAARRPPPVWAIEQPLRTPLAGRLSRESGATRVPRRGAEITHARQRVRTKTCIDP